MLATTKKVCTNLGYSYLIVILAKLRLTKTIVFRHIFRANEHISLICRNIQTI